MDEGAWIEDLGGEALVEGPHWLLERRATVRLVLASALALAFLFTGYVRFAYGVWTPVESPAVIDGYRLADSAPVALAEVRAWATIHDPGPREPIVLEPVLGRLPLSGHAWDGRHVGLPLPADLWLRVGPDRYLRYERPPGA